VVDIIYLRNGHKGKRRLRVKAPLDGNITAMAKNNKGSPLALQHGILSVFIVNYCIFNSKRLLLKESELDMSNNNDKNHLKLAAVRANGVLFPKILLKKSY
jgi:hypothetical protein